MVALRTPRSVTIGPLVCGNFRSYALRVIQKSVAGMGSSRKSRRSTGCTMRGDFSVAGPRSSAGLVIRSLCLGELPVVLKVAAGRLDLSSDSIVFQLQDGASKVVCTIARPVLRELGHYYGLSASEEAVFSELLSGIERLASAKFDARRFDQRNELSIETFDLLRYGRALWGMPIDMLVQNKAPLDLKNPCAQPEHTTEISS